MNAVSVAGPQILLAEDNPVNRTVALASLRRMGFDAHVAHDGGEAVALFERNAYDLILMDCHMPGTDGIAATVAIRAIERQRGVAGVPVIAVTADLTPENAARCRAAGISDVLAKPFTFTELSTRVAQHLYGDERADAPEDRAAAARAASQAASQAKSDAALDAACLDELRALDDDDSQTVARHVVDLFVRTAETQLAQLREALTAGSLGRAGDVAHTLKSSSAYVGARGLSSLMVQIETDAHGGDASQLDGLAQRADEAFAQIAAELGRVFGVADGACASGTAGGTMMA